VIHVEGVLKVKVRKMVLCTAPILLVGGIAYGNFNGGSEPDYVLNVTCPQD
jgi:hypothetical protein